jgi:hypothetical protein
MGDVGTSDGDPEGNRDPEGSHEKPETHHQLIFFSRAERHLKQKPTPRKPEPQPQMDLVKPPTSIRAGMQAGLQGVLLMEQALALLAQLEKLMVEYTLKQGRAAGPVPKSKKLPNAFAAELWDTPGFDGPLNRFASEEDRVLNDAYDFHMSRAGHAAADDTAAGGVDAFYESVLRIRAAQMMRVVSEAVVDPNELQLSSSSADEDDPNALAGVASAKTAKKTAKRKNTVIPQQDPAVNAALGAIVEGTTGKQPNQSSRVFLDESFGHAAGELHALITRLHRQAAAQTFLKPRAVVPNVSPVDERRYADLRIFFVEIQTVVCGNPERGQKADTATGSWTSGAGVVETAVRQRRMDEDSQTKTRARRLREMTLDVVGGNTMFSLKNPLTRWILGFFRVLP